MQPPDLDNPFDVESILALGGIRRVAALANEVLIENGIHRSFFTVDEMFAIQRTEDLLTYGLRLDYREDKSVGANLSEIFRQAGEIQDNSGNANFVGAMLHHLVGATLELALGVGGVSHSSFLEADLKTSRNADFEVNGIAIHVTTHPGEALIKKAAKNIRAGLKPLIVTLADGVTGAAYLLGKTEWKDRVDVIDASQFLTANVYERSLFKAGECKATLTAILMRYNEIVAESETDPVLQIRF